MITAQSGGTGNSLQKRPQHGPCRRAAGAERHTACIASRSCESLQHSLHTACDARRPARPESDAPQPRSASSRSHGECIDRCIHPAARRGSSRTAGEAAAGLRALWPPPPLTSPRPTRIDVLRSFCTAPAAAAPPALNHRRRHRRSRPPPSPPPRPPAEQPKLTSVQLWKYNGPDKDPFLLGVASDLSTFGFFQRGAVGEMLTFVGRTVARRTQVGGWARCRLEGGGNAPQLGWLLVGALPPAAARCCLGRRTRVPPLPLLRQASHPASAPLVPLPWRRAAGGSAAVGAAGGVLLPRLQQGRAGGHCVCGRSLPRPRRLLRGGCAPAAAAPGIAGDSRFRASNA